MCIAISEYGISESFFSVQQLAINKTTYLNECFTARSIPSVENNHCKQNVLLWPDPATIRKKLVEVDVTLVQTMFLYIRKQLRRIPAKGPYEACSF